MTCTTELFQGEPTVLLRSDFTTCLPQAQNGFVPCSSSFPSSDLYPHANTLAKHCHLLWAAPEELQQMFTELLPTKQRCLTEIPPGWFFREEVYTSPSREDVYYLRCHPMMAGGRRSLYLRFQAIPILPNLSGLRRPLG